jgi:membrane protease YdiL (CAAX protease family)
MNQFVKQLANQIATLENYHQQLISRPERWPVWHTWILLTTACFSLFLVNYLKYTSTFTQVLTLLSQHLNLPGLAAYFFEETQFPMLWPCLWWTLIHLLGFITLPCVAMRLLKEPLTDLGFGINHLKRHIFWYVAISSMIIFFAFIASYRHDFQATYPFYSQAGRSGWDWLAWSLLYAIQFIAVEFFFRGFLVHRFKHQFGLHVIGLMCLPYLMLHFTKPWPESFGAFGFGVMLGLLSLFSRSIWGGVLTHVSIATAMDGFALWQKNQLPQVFWPNFF